MVLIERKIASTFEAVHDLVEEILEILHSLEIEQISEEEFKFNIMLREVLNNAVEHGNQFEEHKKVYCKVELEEDILIFVVQDQGAGIELDEYYHIMSKFPLKHRARGLELLTKYDFDYKLDGNKIVVKYLLVRSDKDE